VDQKARNAAVDVLSQYRVEVKRARDSRLLSAQRRAAIKAANDLLPRVNAVLLRLVPDMEPISVSLMWQQHDACLNRVYRAEEVLGDWDSMTEVRADGTEIVQFGTPLNALDVDILEAARHDWDHGHWRQAVANAAAMLNKRAQDRLGVHDISDSELMSHAFNPDPPKENRPRLRCPGDPASTTARAMQDGAKLFAMGAFMAIRNPAVHWTWNGNPAMAGEQLAALSIVAHWVKYWDVVRYKLPMPGTAELLEQINASQAGKRQ